MRIRTLSIVTCLAAILSGVARAQTSGEHWIQTFGISPATYTVKLHLSPKDAKNYEALSDPTPLHGTLRYRFAVSVGGQQIRVKLSNEASDKPLCVKGASIGLAGEGANAATGSLHRLTFAGKADIVIPAGAPVLSDPVSLSIKPLSELVASIWVGDDIPANPLGGTALQQGPDDAVMQEAFASPKLVHARPIISGVLVSSSKPTRVVVGFGDSITDGGRESFDQAHGWVAHLATRVVSSNGPPIAIVSAGISGNRVIRGGFGDSALARADRDLFSIPGVTDVIFLEGINDIGLSGKPMPEGIILGDELALSLDQLLAGYAQIAARAHAHGLKIYMGTLTPFRGAATFSEEKEKLRLAANQWIRTSHLFDGVIDFDAALRDPSNLDQLNKTFDSGDHLHPNETGYAAMSTAVPLGYFR